ncbi:MAG TPA: DUF302 domain-containing protein [Methylococcales bacterium]
MDTDPMIIEKVSPWDFEKTVEFLLGAATKMNWNILTVHDLQHSLAKAGKIVNPVKVLEICKPEHSGKILSKNDERIVSVLLPCRLSVYLKEDGKTYVAIMNIAALLPAMPKTVHKVMTAASDELIEIVDSVIG